MKGAFGPKLSDQKEAVSPVQAAAPIPELEPSARVMVAAV